MRQFIFLAVSGLLLSLSSCCSYRTCDCFDEGENDVSFYFDSDSLNQGFREAGLRGTYAVRYESASFATALDTTYRQPGLRAYDSSFCEFYVRLNSLFPPRPGTAQPFTAYAYALVLPQTGRRYQITDIELAGERRGNRCCTCYSNTRKRLRLDGQYIVADGQLHPNVLKR